MLRTTLQRLMHSRPSLARPAPGPCGTLPAAAGPMDVTVFRLGRDAIFTWQRGVGSAPACAWVLQESSDPRHVGAAAPAPPELRIGSSLPAGHAAAVPRVALRPSKGINAGMPEDTGTVWWEPRPELTCFSSGAVVMKSLICHKNNYSVFMWKCSRVEEAG